MVADAMCLWTAAALPAFGPAPTEVASASGSPRGAGCPDRRDADNRARAITPCRPGAVASSPQIAPGVSRTNPFWHAAVAATTSSPTKNCLFALSLIYLSLSGAWPPAQGGWGAVHRSITPRASQMSSRNHPTILKGRKRAVAESHELGFDPLPRPSTGRFLCLHSPAPWQSRGSQKVLKQRSACTFCGS